MRTRSSALRGRSHRLGLRIGVKPQYPRRAPQASEEGGKQGSKEERRRGETVAIFLAPKPSRVRCMQNKRSPGRNAPASSSFQGPSSLFLFQVLPAPPFPPVDKAGAPTAAGACRSERLFCRPRTTPIPPALYPGGRGGGAKLGTMAKRTVSCPSRGRLPRRNRGSVYFAYTGIEFRATRENTG